MTGHRRTRFTMYGYGRIWLYVAIYYEEDAKLAGYRYLCIWLHSEVVIDYEVKIKISVM
jgi:hypothetical protein